MIYGVVVVVAQEGRYLVIRRAAGVVAPGAWCFVGGAIERDETQAAAVVREFREELGAAVQPVERVWEYTRPDGLLHLYWWRARLLSSALQPNPAEVAEFRWCTPAEIALLPALLPSNRAFLAAHGLV